MALSTYTELQAELVTYMAGRSDLTNLIVDAIRMAESRLNYGGEGFEALRVRQMENRATASLTAGDDSIELPSDYLASKTLKIDGYPPLRFVTKEMLDQWYSDGSTGRPVTFTVAAGEYIVRPIPDGTYTLENLYYQPIPALASNSTNWLLTAAPHIYLYGALAELKRYARVLTMNNVDYQGMLIAAVEALRRQDVGAMMAGPLQMRPQCVV